MLGIDRILQYIEKTVLGLDNVQVGCEMVAELVDDQLGFVLAQQPVVDENAGQLRPDG